MRLIIIGGVAGGMSAATRARRLDEGADIIVFEKGPDVSFANCGLPYFIGGAIEERDRLPTEYSGTDIPPCGLPGTYSTTI